MSYKKATNIDIKMTMFVAFLYLIKFPYCMYIFSNRDVSSTLSSIVKEHFQLTLSCNELIPI